MSRKRLSIDDCRLIAQPLNKVSNDIESALPTLERGY